MDRFVSNLTLILLKTKIIFIRIQTMYSRSKALAFLFLGVFFVSGCTVKWIDDDLLKEENLNKVKVSQPIKVIVDKKIKFKFRKNYEKYHIRKTGENLEYSLGISHGVSTNKHNDFIVESKYVSILKTSLNKSLFFDLRDTGSVSYKLEVVFYPKYEFEQNLMYAISTGLTFATIPFPLNKHGFKCEFKLYSQDNKLIKTYQYIDKVKSGVIGFPLVLPFASLYGENAEEIIQTLMDKFVSNLIIDIVKNNDHVYQDSDNV